MQFNRHCRKQVLCCKKSLPTSANLTPVIAPGLAVSPTVRDRPISDLSKGHHASIDTYDSTFKIVPTGKNGEINSAVFDSSTPGESNYRLLDLHRRSINNTFCNWPAGGVHEVLAVDLQPIQNNCRTKVGRSMQNLSKHHNSTALQQPAVVHEIKLLSSRPFVTAYWGSFCIEPTLLDSGSQISIIDQQFYEHLVQTHSDPCLTLKPTSISAVGASKTQLSLKGYISIPITIGDATRVQDLFVCPLRSTRLLCGMDTIKNFKMVIDAAKNEVFTPTFTDKNPSSSNSSWAEVAALKKQRFQSSSAPAAAHNHHQQQQVSQQLPLKHPENDSSHLQPSISVTDSNYPNVHSTDVVSTNTSNAGQSPDRVANGRSNQKCILLPSFQPHSELSGSLPANGKAILAREVFLPASSSLVAKLNFENYADTSHHNLNHVLSIYISSVDVLSVDALVTITPDGSGHAVLTNPSLEDMTITRGTAVGTWSSTPLDPITYQSFAGAKSRIKKSIGEVAAVELLSDQEKRAFIRDNAKLDHLSPELKARIINLLYEYFDVISTSPTDLGRTQSASHTVRFPPNHTTQNCYVKQFPVPMKDLEIIRKTNNEWLEAGITEPCSDTRYSSPIFVVSKKDPETGKPTGSRCVVDYRRINDESAMEHYRLPLVQECISSIGEMQPRFFSSLDLRSGFQQLPLADEHSKDATAFNIPGGHGTGGGRFRFTMAPYGLHSLPSTFQRLMDLVLTKIPHCIVYMDDILSASKTEDEMFDNLAEIFDRLRLHRLKLNITKCRLLTQSCDYLGYTLTPNGYTPHNDKVQAINDLEPPTTVREIRSFCGMVGYFRQSIRGFAHILKPLTTLTCKANSWTGRKPLPPAAQAAFESIKELLTKAPLLAYPRNDGLFKLFVDASQGTVTTLGPEKGVPGGLASCLTQDQDGVQRIINFASRGLTKHELSYTPYLLELQSIIWGVHYNHVFLHGRFFECFCDHRPIIKLVKQQARTLHRLNELLLDYNFSLFHVDGSDNPADIFSRSIRPALGNEAEVQQISSHHFDPLGISTHKMIEFQTSDPFCIKLIDFLTKKTLPLDKRMATLIKKIAPDCKFDLNGILCRLVVRPGYRDHWCIVLPLTFVGDILYASHGNIVSGHHGNNKTVDKILTRYWWPGIHRDVYQHIQMCHPCQMSSGKDRKNAPLLPLPTTYKPFSRLHLDLMGPFLAVDYPDGISSSSKKYILVAVDSYTKFITLVPIANKTPETVGHALFSRVVCIYSCPQQITSDMGVEFCSKVSQKLYDMLHVSKVNTSAYHPSSNSQAELLMKHIRKFLQTTIDQNNLLDWPTLLPACQLSWNCSISRATKETPFYLLFNTDPNLPFFNTDYVAKPHYSDDWADNLAARLKAARASAVHNNHVYRTTYTRQYDANVKLHNFQIGDLVLAHQPETLQLNRKLAHQWTGPHTILALNIEQTALVQHLRSKKSKLFNTQRLKKYVIGEHPDLDIHHLQFDPRESSSRPALSRVRNSADRQLVQPQGERDSNLPQVAGDSPDIIWCSTGPLPLPKILRLKQEPQDPADSPPPTPTRPSTSSNVSSHPSKLRTLVNRLSPDKHKLSQMANALAHPQQTRRANMRSNTPKLPDSVLNLPSRPLEHRSATRGGGKQSAARPRAKSAQTSGPASREDPNLIQLAVDQPVGAAQSTQVPLPPPDTG